MNSLKDVCTVIPVVLLTGVAVIGVATRPQHGLLVVAVTRTGLAGLAGRARPGAPAVRRGLLTVGGCTR